MIYQLVNKRAEILSLATSHFPIYATSKFNHVFAQLISVPRFKSINFYQNRPKIKKIKLKIGFIKELKTT